MKKLLFPGVVAVLSLGMFLPGCVSSKKYKASQATVAQLRVDSADCVNKNTVLNENINSMQQNNTRLQTSVDSMNTYIVKQRPNMDYQAYFTQQQNSGTQLLGDLKTSLEAAGLTSANIQEKNGSIYIVLNDDMMFTGNSVNVNTKGKEVLNSIAQVVKNHPGINVSIADAPAVGTDGTTTTNNGNNDVVVNTETTTTTTTTTDPSTTKKTIKKNKTHYDGQGKVASSGTTPKKSKTTVHKTTVSKENKNVVYRSKGTKSNMAKKSNSAALRSSRTLVVSKTLLQNGVPKVSTISQNNATVTDPRSQAIHVILSPAMDEFYDKYYGQRTSTSSR